VRASYYSKNLQTNIVTDNEALAGVLSVMCNAAGPIGKSVLDGKKNPNINPTRWTTLSDQEKQVYYFSAAQGPFIIYLSLNDKDIKCRLASLDKGLALKLSLNKNNGTLMHQGKDVAGSAEMYLEDCVPFDFLPAN
jgi:penicillin V acylase-like amidase (Ntn superfamily)